MEFLLDPNVAYALIVATALLALVAIIIPGTGLPEIGLLFCLTLAGYEVYQLGVQGEVINAWALAVLILSVIPFVLSIRATKWRWPLLVATILLMVAGSIFLFTKEGGWPTVNPVLAGFISLLNAGLVWFGVNRTVIAMHKQPIHDPDKLIGQTGETRTEVHEEGSVQVAGELWSARSEKPIKTGSAVRVLKRDGFVLVVEKATE